MISFRSGVGTLKTETIQVEGFGSFEVTFQVPGSADLLNADVLASREDAGSAALWLAAKCLRSWTLEPALPQDLEGRVQLLGGIDPPEALLSLYLRLRESGREQLKN